MLKWIIDTLKQYILLNTDTIQKKSILIYQHKKEIHMYLICYSNNTLTHSYKNIIKYTSN